MQRPASTLGSVGLSALALACAAKKPPEAKPVPTPQAQVELGPSHARHVLNRLAFGPKPGQVAELAKIGLDPWLSQQLAAKKAVDPALEAELAPYADALASPAELVRRALGSANMQDALANKGLKKKLKSKARQHLAKLALAELTRHMTSERQVEEVLVDFWTNHFNVFARKGLVQLFAGDYIERALRPNALGRFQDLLIATARHPAMLLYLDNARSVRQPEMATANKKRRGLNENYARELLELHTLGVDGGYTQADVIDVARILTGFSVSRPREGDLSFLFRERAHDRGEKHVLGKHFPAGRGEEEGIELLKMLAAHPKTARHLATKLCARLVADDPPKACVDRAARAYLESGGDIRSVIRAIVWSPEFFGAESKKLKSPLEIVASAARGIGAKLDGSLRGARVLVQMGEPILLEPVPTGYPEAEEDWLGSGGMLARMSLASLFGAEKLPGFDVDLDRVFEDPSGDIAARVSETLLGESPSVEVIRQQVRDVSDPRERRAIAVALVLGSPEFQRQ